MTGDPQVTVVDRRLHTLRIAGASLRTLPALLNSDATWVPLSRSDAAPPVTSLAMPPRPARRSGSLPEPSPKLHMKWCPNGRWVHNLGLIYLPRQRTEG